MLQVKVLSGRMAGTLMEARHFPFKVGRDTGSDLTLHEAGVWDQHLEIHFEPGNGFLAVPLGEALMTLNGAPAARTRLRNGDRIEFGSVALQVWLGETRQRGLQFHEWVMWLTYAALVGVQLYLILKLL